MRAAVAYRVGIDLRHRHEQTQLVRRCHVKQLCPRRAAVARLNQRADIDIARRDHAIERRIDLFEALQLLQAPHVGLGGRERRLARAEVAGGLVGLLPGDGIFGQQLLPSLGGDLRNLLVGLRGCQIGLCLLHLLVEFRSLDLGQNLSAMHARADVGIPLAQVAVGARIDRRVDVGLRIRGKRDLERACALHRAWSRRRRERHSAAKCLSASLRRERASECPSR